MSSRTTARSMLPECETQFQNIAAACLEIKTALHDVNTSLNNGIKTNLESVKVQVRFQWVILFFVLTTVLANAVRVFYAANI